MSSAEGRRKRLPATRLGMFLESMAPWRNTLLVVVAVGTLYGASRIDSLRPTFAAVVGLGAPACLFGHAATRVLSGSRALRIVTLVVLLTGVGFLGRELWRVFVPPAPIAAAELTSAEPDVAFPVPADERAFDVEVRGRLLSEDGQAEGHYSLDLERGDARRSVGGELYRRIRVGHVGRRGPAVESTSVHEAARHPIELRGAGPVHAHLASLSGLHDRLVVSISSAPLVGTVLWMVLAALVLGGVVVEAWAAREGLAASVTAAIVASEALAVDLVYRYDPGDPVSTMFGALLFAGLAYGVGFVLGAVVAAIARPRRPV